MDASVKIVITTGCDCEIVLLDTKQVLPMIHSARPTIRSTIFSPVICFFFYFYIENWTMDVQTATCMELIHA